MAGAEGRAAALLLALAVGLPAAGQEELRAAFAASYAAEAAGDPAAAERALAAAAAARPGHYLLNLRLGWLALARGDGRQAELRYRTARLIAPASLEARLGLARALMQQGRWPDARSEVYEVLAVEPGQVAAGLLLATILLEQGYPRSAGEVVQRLLAAHPADADAAALAARIRAVGAEAPVQAGKAQADAAAAAWTLSLTGEGVLWGYGGATARQWAALGGIGLGVRVAGLGEAAATVEQTVLAYRDRDPYRQTDANLLLGGWAGAWYLRGGGHAIRDPGHGWSAGATAFAGAWWQALPWCGAGCDLSWSRFHVAEPPVQAVEAIPRLGAWLDLGAGWTAGAELNATAIGLDRDLGQGRSALLSAGGRLWAAHADWSLSLSGWAGDRIYHVAPGGVAVMDLPARYRRGWEASVGRTWGSWSATLAAGMERFSETWDAGTASAARIALTATLAF